MSAVDDFKGHNIRRQGSQHEPDTSSESSSEEPEADEQVQGGFKSNAQASYFVNEESKKELRALGEDLAIVCPLIDGRMRDLRADQ